jgi:hypothetical protein
MKMDEIKDLNKEHCEVMASDLIKEKEKKPKQNDEKVFTIFMTSVFIFFICIISFILISEIGLNKNLPLDKLIFVTVLTLILIFGISLSLENRRVRKIYEKNLIALQNDKEYQLAKEIMRKYEEKNYRYKEEQIKRKKKENLNDVFDEELKKTERIIEMENFLKR